MQRSGLLRRLVLAESGRTLGRLAVPRRLQGVSSCYSCSSPTTRTQIGEPAHNAIAHPRHQFFSTDSTSNAFDRDLKRQQRENAARTHKVWKGGDDVVDYDYFRHEMAYRLVDRLDDIKKDEGFPLALDIGRFRGWDTA
jgi:hypothetical protein